MQQIVQYYVQVQRPAAWALKSKFTNRINGALQRRTDTGFRPGQQSRCGILFFFWEDKRELAHRMNSLLVKQVSVSQYTGKKFIWERGGAFMVRIGELIDGRYRALRELGRGGAGIVYLVLHEQAGQLRAMKVMHGKGSGQTLQEELRILRGLRHEMLPQIEDVVFLGEDCCLIMQYIEGKTLEQIVQGRKVGLREALRWGSQLCDVMTYLHGRPVPVFYLDLKPANIILDGKGRLSLVDFGSARSIYAGGKLGKELPLTGTPGYAAPELYTDELAGDARADVYSIGAVLYYLLCRKKPHGGETREQCLQAIRLAGAGEGMRSGERVRIEEVAQILSVCLRTDPARRPADCRHLSKRFLHAAGEGRLQRMLGRGERLLYLIAAAGSIFCLIASLLCFYAAAGMRSRVYSSNMQRAALAGDEERARLLQEAADLYPEKGETYIQLLEAAAADGFFSTLEQSRITEMLYRRSMGRIRENIDYLQEDEDAFIQFACRLGAVYFFLAGEGGDHYAAAGWLKKAVDPECISACRYPVRAARTARDAQILLDLCDYYSRDVAAAQGGDKLDADALWELLRRLLRAALQKKDSTEKKWFLREWLRIFYDNMDFLHRAEGEGDVSLLLDTVGRELMPAGGSDPDMEELRELYDCMLDDWRILCGSRS